jgi:ABC-type nitrate/sulfonate/bicarbonate transport system substrate-binding protein
MEEHHRAHDPRRSLSRRSLLRGSTAGAVVMALGASCGGGKSGGGAAPAARGTATPVAKKLATVRLGYQTNIWGMPLLVAIQSGAFKKYNVPIDAIQVSSGNKTRDLMVAGQADMGTFAAPAFIIGVDKGQLQAVGIVAYVPKTLAVVARKGITSVEELRGKKLALTQGTSASIILQNNILPTFNLNKADYQAVNLEPENMTAALAQGSIDAMDNVEPYNAVAVAQGIGARLLDYEKYDLLPVLLCVRPEFAKSNPDTVTGIMAGMLATQNLFKSQPAQASDLINKYYTGQGFKLDPKIMQDIIPRLDVEVDLTPKLKDYLQSTAESQLKLGQIAAIPNWDVALPRQYLDQAGSMR